MLNCSVHPFPKMMPKSNRGERPWNGELLPPKFKNGVSRMRVGRKLEDVHQELVLLGEQGKAKGFFTNVENAEKLGGLVEDVRDVLIDYQVCASNNIPFSCSSFL